METEADYLAALETPPDLILADWSLPQFSGLRALKLMRERGLDTPFVIVSGSIGEEAAVDALRQGASDYVLKDRPARLGPAVRRALEEKSLREERKRAEEALRESEEQYRILVENASEAIFVAQDGKLRFVNGRSQEIIGYTREELISRTFIEFVHPDDRELLMDRHIQRQQGVDLPSRYSFRIVHATGETRWMELSTVRIEWAGRPATLNFMSDITERKRAEDEREKLQAQFLQAQKMESVGRLAGGVAHDFNNMLGIILGYAEMALDQVDPAERLHAQPAGDLQSRAALRRPDPAAPGLCPQADHQAPGSWI